MPIVSGNEPEKHESGRGIWWLLPILLIASGPIASMVQQATGWNVSQLQVILAGGLLLAAVWLLWPNFRGGRGSAAPGIPTPPTLPARLPTPSTPSRSPAAPRSIGGSTQLGRPIEIPAPKFEPYVTGKVVLAGCVLLVLFGAVGLALVLAGL